MCVDLHIYISSGADMIIDYVNQKCQAKRI